MKNYYRQFITLLQEKSGFALPGRAAAGRIVLEARGDDARATVYIQDITPQNSYKLAFISRRGGANFGVNVGSIIVGERGRYEGRFEFDAQSIGGSGIKIAEIEGAVVLVADSDDENMQAPLVGFRDSPFSWRVNFNFADGKQLPPPSLSVAETEMPEIFAEEVPPPVYDFEISETVPTVADEGPVHLFTENEIIQAFSDENADISWVAVTLKDVADLGGKWAKIAKSPHISASFERYRHILLGRTTNDGANAYVVGVPDVFRVDTCHDHAADEYCSFKLCKPGEQAPGAPGYWLRWVE